MHYTLLIRKSQVLFCLCGIISFQNLAFLDLERLADNHNEIYQSAYSETTKSQKLQNICANLFYIETMIDTTEENHDKQTVGRFSSDTSIYFTPL